MDIFLPFIIKILQRAMQGSYNRTVFFNRWNGQVAFTVTNTSPDAATADQFIALLTTEIERAAPFDASGEGLADQLAKLDAFRSRGVLTDTEFAAAKQRVLSMGVEEKRIGFGAAARG